MRNREAEVQEEARKRERELIDRTEAVDEPVSAKPIQFPSDEERAVARKAPYAGVIIPGTKHSNRCLSTAKDDEPIFVLKASDLLAVPAVGYWIDMARATGVNAEKIEDARRHMDQMTEWRARNGAKVPD
jgi:hypothetical protein